MMTVLLLIYLFIYFCQIFTIFFLPKEKIVFTEYKSQ